MHAATTTAGDPDPELERLVAAHSDAVLAYVVRWTRDREMAEDVLQETWVRAWRHREKLVESRGSVRGWLLRVAHNVAIDQYRAHRNWPAGVEPDHDTGGPCAAAAVEHERVLDRVLVDQVLAAASPALRSTLVEVYLHDQTFVEAAEQLGVPVGTVKSRLHYGLRELRASMPRSLAS